MENVSRYPLYLVTVLLGGIWAGVKPFADLYRKSPVTAASLLVLGSLGFFLIYCTLRGMSGEAFFPTWFPWA
ncbi:MAG: hypothetical protein OHK0012_26110 [Synechococcales cyanobacterium]